MITGELAAMRCAIHQPNLFPRLSTLAKLFAADIWIALDDVQFNRRDYQHRSRLASPHDHNAQQWLSLPVHLPKRRATLIRDVRLIDPDRAQRRTDRMIRHYYRRRPKWSTFSTPLEMVLAEFQRTDRLADISRASTLVLLRLLGWRGRLYSSSSLNARTERTERLADLTRAVGANTYLCGTGGARYLVAGPFADLGIGIEQFAVPQEGDTAIWEAARRVSALRPLMSAGPAALARELRKHARLPSQHP